MTNKFKGFTLIEVLATVVVLAIVLLIAVPITLNIIDNAKKRSFVATSIIISDDIKNALTKDIIETNIDSKKLEGTIVLDDDIRDRLQIGSNYEGYIVVTKNSTSFENRLFISDTKAKYSICDETNETVTVKKVYNVSSCNAVLSGIQIKPGDTEEIETEILDGSSMKLLARFNDTEVKETDKKVLWEVITDDTLTVSISDNQALKPTFTFTGYGEVVIKLTSLLNNSEDRVKIMVYPNATSLRIVKLDGSAIDGKTFEVGTNGNLIAVFEPEIANLNYVEWSIVFGEENVSIEQVGDREVNVNAIHSGNVTLKAYSPITKLSREVIFYIREDSPPEFSLCKIENTAITNGVVNILINVYDIGGSGYMHTIKPDSSITTLSTFTYPVTTNGTYTFTSLDFDNNSNACEVVVNNIDDTVPTASLVSSNTNYTNQSITLNITANDTNFSHIILPDNSTVLTKTYNYPVSANGTYSFKVYDKAGNMITKSITVSNIDKVNPILNLTQSPTSFTNGNVTITAASSDALSGFYRVLLPNGTYSTSASITYAVSANGTYSFTAYDKAGNSLVKTITVSNIDKTAPTFSKCDVTSANSTSNTFTITVSDTGDSGYYRTLRPNGTYSTSSSFTYTVSSSGTYNFTAYDNAGNSKVCSAVAIVGTVNPPILASGMIPIKWDGSTAIDTTANDPDWYNYSTSAKKWANARTEDGSMWVWIPRYAYQITSGYHSSTAGTIAIKFLRGTSDTAYDLTTVASVNQGNNPGSNVRYVTHPAFKFGDDEITGFWMMKFEASSSNGTVTSLPNAVSWRNLTVNSMFNLSRAMEKNDSYGWGTSGSGIDTHMHKDVEWGAVAYLSWSAYGKNSEVWDNNSAIRITGCAGYSIHPFGYDFCQNQYNTDFGQNASTTGNYYGIYDMAGGSAEYTASYVSEGGKNLTTNGSSLVSANSKYKDSYLGSSTDQRVIYELNSGYYGNAVYETSLTGNYNGFAAWNKNFTGFISYDYPFSSRGLTYGNSGAGVFSSHCGVGTASESTWRVALVVQAGM